jgi:hypothetical protein
MNLIAKREGGRLHALSLNVDLMLKSLLHVTLQDPHTVEAFPLGGAAPDSRMPYAAMIQDLFAT